MRKYTYNTKMFDDRSEVAMYISGMAHADGSFGKSGLDIKLHCRDIDILQKMRDFVCPEHPIYDYMKHGNMMDLQFGSHYIRDSVDVIISDFISNPKSIDFVRGFFDGDGTITTGWKFHKNNYRAAFYNNDTDTLEAISHILREHGLNDNSPTKHCGNCFALWYCGSSSKDLYDVMYKDALIYGDRKKKRFEELLFSGRTEIESVNAPHLLAEMKG